MMQSAWARFKAMDEKTLKNLSHIIGIVVIGLLGLSVMGLVVLGVVFTRGEREQAAERARGWTLVTTTDGARYVGHLGLEQGYGGLNLTDAYRVESGADLRQLPPDFRPLPAVGAGTARPGTPGAPGAPRATARPFATTRPAPMPAPLPITPPQNTGVRVVRLADLNGTTGELRLSERAVFSTETLREDSAIVKAVKISEIQNPPRAPQRPGERPRGAQPPAVQSVLSGQSDQSGQAEMDGFDEESLLDAFDR